MQPGDVAETRADVEDLMRDVGFGRLPPSRKGSAGSPRGIGNFMHGIDKVELKAFRSNAAI